MKRVAFGVTYPRESLHPIHRRVARTDGVSRMELLMWGPTDSVTTLSWYDAGRETVEGVLDAVGSLTASHLVAADGGTYAFVHQTDYEFGDELLDLVATPRVVFLPPVTFREDGDATFEAVGETTALSGFYARLNETLDARIERVRGFERGSSATLTERRRAAVAAATAAGYYDVPRTGSVEDVAAELGCSSSTAGELLRRAESTLVADYVASNERGPR